VAVGGVAMEALGETKEALEQQLAERRAALDCLRRGERRKARGDSGWARRMKARAVAVYLLEEDSAGAAMSAFCAANRLARADVEDVVVRTSIEDLVDLEARARDGADRDGKAARRFAHEWMLNRWVVALNEDHGVAPASAALYERREGALADGDREAASLRACRQWAWRFRRRWGLRFRRLRVHGGAAPGVVQQKAPSSGQTRISGQLFGAVLVPRIWAEFRGAPKHFLMYGWGGIRAPKVSHGVRLLLEPRSSRGGASGTTCGPRRRRAGPCRWW
jgi:hypothetical protein